MSNARKLADNLPSVGQLGNRNIVINGKFDVDQRHSFGSHAVTAGGDYFADRWGFYSDANAVAQYSATTQVVSDGPTGFEKSLKWTTTSAGTVPATSEVIFRQKIEGYNINQVDYGTANAKELTLSFYVKSSIAGNYGFTVFYTDSGGTNRFILKSYTINSANTWEHKIITIPANTANALQQKTNGPGFSLGWDLGEGATYSGSVTGNWQSAYVNGLTGGVKIANNNGATWQITGVQLEVGSQASPFEHEPVGVTLSKCQRYFQKIAGPVQGYPMWTYGGTTASTHFQLTTQMRVTPTATFTGTTAQNSAASITNDNFSVYSDAAWRGTNSNGVVYGGTGSSSENSIRININPYTNFGGGLSAGLYIGSNCSINIDAEL